MELSKDEIVRLTQLNKLSRSIKLEKCKCGKLPIAKFISCKEYYIECPNCKESTECYRYEHLAKQAWNKGKRRKLNESNVGCKR